MKLAKGLWHQEEKGEREGERVRNFVCVYARLCTFRHRWSFSFAFLSLSGEIDSIIFAAPLQREDFLIKYIIKGLRPDSARIIGVTRPLMRRDLPPIGVSGNNARVTM